MIENVGEKEEGQSTIEFLVSFTLILGFIFAFLRLAVVYTNGYLLHYVTFQASRAYMVGESNGNDPDISDNEAKKQAERVFDSYVVDVIIPNYNGNLSFEPPTSHLNNSTNLYVGVRLEYEDQISIPGTNQKITFPMVSESYLGMEPTRAECFKRICSSLRDVGPGAGCVKHSTVMDNGC